MRGKEAYFLASRDDGELGLPLLLSTNECNFDDKLYLSERIAAGEPMDKK